MNKASKKLGKRIINIFADLDPLTFPKYWESSGRSFVIQVKLVLMLTSL